MKVTSMKMALVIGAVLLMVGMPTIAADVQEFQIRLNQHTQIPVGNYNLRVETDN